MIQYESDYDRAIRELIQKENNQQTVLEEDKGGKMTREEILDSLKVHPEMKLW